MDNGTARKYLKKNKSPSLLVTLVSYSDVHGHLPRKGLIYMKTKGVTKGLHYLHTKGIRHGDLKAVVFSPEGRVGH